MSTEAVFYRYDDVRTTRGASVVLHRFRVEKRTRCGVWIDAYGVRRFVLTYARKRYACPSIEEARVSFLARKRRQLALLRAQVDHVERAIVALNEPKPVGVRFGGVMYE